NTLRTALAAANAAACDSGLSTANLHGGTGTGGGGIGGPPPGGGPTEDTPVALAINAQFGDFLDGSETHTVTIAAPPDGWTVVDLNGWTHNADGSFSLDVTDKLDASGRVSGAGPPLLPPQDFNGAVDLQVQAVATENVPNDSDTSNNVAVATTTLTIDVAPVNDAPVAAADSYSTDEDKTLTVAGPGVLANDHDVDSPTLHALLVDGPQHAELALNADGNVPLTPHAHYNRPH